LFIATLGAGFVFSTILSNIPPPVSVFSFDQIRLLLAVSLLLFMWTLALAGILIVVLLFVGGEIDPNWREDARIIVGSFLICVIILSTLISAFIFIGLAITAYQFWVGIVGIGSAGCVWIASIILGMFQLYRELRRRRKKAASRITE
jgi:hypothetical protein